MKKNSQANPALFRQGKFYLKNFIFSKKISHSKTRNSKKCGIRIGIDARMYGPKQTGIGNYIKNLIKHLAEIDKENEYIIFLLEKEFEKFNPPAENFKKQKVSAHWYSWREQFILPFEFKKAKVDLMHFPHFNRPVLYSGKSIVTIHDLTPKFFPGHKMNSLIRKIGFWLTFSSAVKKSEKIIAVSQATKNDIVKYFKIAPEKIKVIYEGIDKEKFHSPESGIPKCRLRLKEKYNITKPFILYVGVWRSHKNMVGLIKAFDILLKKYRIDYQLVLTGEENPYYPEIRKTWQNLSLEKNIICPGFVSKKDLVGLYKETSLCVIPSFYEGFGLVGLEAMSQGAPVASSDIPCLKEISGNAAIFFNPYDVNDMAEKISMILSDENLRKKIIKQGFEQIKKYNWKKMAKETLEIYKKVMSIPPF